MRNTSTETIDGQKYLVGHWHVDKQLEVMTRLIKILGEPLAMLIMGSESSKGQSLKDKLDGEMNMDAIAQAFKGLALRLNEEEVKTLFKDVTHGVKCDGKDIDFNTQFMGRIGHLFKVSLFCIKHQYQDFLGDVPALGGISGTARAATTTQAASV